jgi:signal transduction histidine kinase
MYAPVRGLSGVLPWALLAGVTLLAFLVVILVRRLARGSSELAEANVALAAQNEQVVAANRMKSDFLATMSHELRTPLNGIIGFAELMHDGRVGPVSDQHREYLGDILSSADHLRRLIDDVLDLSKIEAGKIDLRPETVSCRELVEEVCDVVGSLAVRKDITLSCDIDPAIDPLLLDPGKLKQVLFNYVSNALKFTPDGGKVTITGTVEDGDRFRLVVEDDGPGIEQADLDRLWTAFEQLDTGSSRRHGGTGLGLSLTRRIVEAQGGEVGVDTAPGRGSRFSVVLPRVVTSERTPIAEPTSAEPVAV